MSLNKQYMNLNSINPDIKCEDISAALDFATKSIIDSVISTRDEFIKQKLLEKGYDRLVDEMNYCRFPKMCIVSYDGWQYVFVDNGTIQGDFIVAVKIAAGVFNSLSPTEIKANIEWQDTNFEAVRIPESVHRGKPNMHGIYKSDQEAANAGVPVNGFYQLSQPNDYWMPGGTIKQRLT